MKTAFVSHHPPRLPRVLSLVAIGVCISVSALLLAGAAPSPARAASNGHITGTVSAQGGGPLGSIHVEPFQSDGAGGWTAVGVGVRTLDDGTYDLSLPAGTYRLWFQDTNFGNPIHYVFQWFNDQQDPLWANSVSVTAGAKTSKVNAALWPSQISGTVSAQGGGALAGIHVQPFQSNGAGGWTAVGSGVLTDANGDYFLGLPEPMLVSPYQWDYRIQFSDPSGNYLGQCYKNKPDLTSASDVVVTFGSSTDGINATLVAPPRGTMQLDNGATATNSTTVTADSAVTGATQMRFAFYNGTVWIFTAWQPYAAKATVSIYAPDGTKRVYGYYRDAAGNTLTATDTIILDTVAPSGTMQLDNGAAYTNKDWPDGLVTVNSAITGASEMRFRCWMGYAWVFTAWQPYAAKATVTLYAPDGTKRVDAYYRDDAGNTYSTSDTIILDTVYPEGGMQLDNDATATNKLTVTADSAVKGASEMRFASYNGTAWVFTAWQPYAAKATVTLYAPDGTKWVHAYYRDDAGNTLSGSDTIVLDTVPPSGTMQLNNGAPATNSTTVTVNSAVTGATRMLLVTQNILGFGYTVWQAYAATATVTLPSPDGRQWVWAFYYDDAGNVLRTFHTIILDTVAPSGTMQLDNGRATTNDNIVTVNSAVTGASEMRFASYNGTAWVFTAWQPYAAKATVTLYYPDGTKRVYGYYRDAAGNTLTETDTIVLSTG